MMANYFDCLPEDVLKFILQFLELDEVFKLISTTTQLWKIANSFDDDCCNHSKIFSKDNRKEMDVSVTIDDLRPVTRFDGVWCKAGHLAFKRYQRLFGPFYKLTFTDDLTSHVRSPDDLSYIMNSLSLYPLSTMNVQITNDQFAQFNRIPVCNSCSHPTSRPECPIKLRNLCLNFQRPLRWVYNAHDDIESISLRWTCYFLKIIDASFLQSLEFSLHVSLLKEVTHLSFFASKGSLLGAFQLPQLKRLRLCISIDPCYSLINPCNADCHYNFNREMSELDLTTVSKREWQIIYGARGRTGFYRHKYLWKTFLGDFLKDSSLEELHIICVVPEAFDSLRFTIKKYFSVVMRMSSIRVTAQYVKTAKETERSKELNTDLQLALYRLTKCLLDLNFILSTESNEYDAVFINTKRAGNPTFNDDWDWDGGDGLHWCSPTV